MGEQPSIRPARPGEHQALAELKCQFLRTMYGGFSAGREDYISLPYYVEQLRDMIADESMRVDVIEQDGELAGYVSYGPDPDAEGFGLIRETLFLRSETIDLHHALLHHTVEALFGMGFQQLHVWTLRPHFRARYLYELYGFRTDGAKKTVTLDGSDFLLLRYRYPVE